MRLFIGYDGLPCAAVVDTPIVVGAPVTTLLDRSNELPSIRSSPNTSEDAC